MYSVSEKIGQDFRAWGSFIQRNMGPREEADRTDNVIFISAPTGTGKTTFILRVFAEYVVRKKKGEMLFLVPRTILQNQMEAILMNLFAERGSFQEFVLSIRIVTYQALENAILRGDELGKFYAVICDEAHYFLEDALFNAEVQRSFDWICNFISNSQGLVTIHSRF